MGEEQSSLEGEIRKLNENLKRVLEDNRFFIYSTKPSKFAFYNFFAGVLRSLGSAIGTLVVFGVGSYFLSRLLRGVDLTGVVSGWLQKVINQASQGLGR